MLATLERRDFAVVFDCDAGICFKAAGEIARHRSGQRGTPDQQTHLRGIPTQEHRSLASRIAAANDQDLGVLAIPSFHVGGRIVHTRTLEIGESSQGKPPILHAARYYDCAGTNALTILENRAEGAVACSL